MSIAICRLLEQVPTGTAVQELMMNGEDVSGVEEFVKYDKESGLVYFTNSTNHVFIAVCDKIDMIEFQSLGSYERENTSVLGRLAKRMKKE